MLSTGTICEVEAHSWAGVVVHDPMWDHPILWFAPGVPSKSPNDGVLHQPTVDTNHEQVVMDDVEQFRTRFLDV